MKNKYEKEVEIEYTNVGRTMNLSVVQATYLIQNIVTQFFELIGSDNIVIKEKNNAAWVVSKLKVHFEKYPVWKDKVKLTCYIVKQSKIRIELEIKAESEDRELLFIAKQEICPIDLSTRKIRKIETIEYPKNLETLQSNYEEPYQRLDTEFADTEKISEREVFAIDTDFTHHTNNVKYLKFMANTFDSNFIDNNEITDIEVHYISESKDGQILNTYKHNKENEIDFLIKRNDEEIIRGNLKYKSHM